MSGNLNISEVTLYCTTTEFILYLEDMLHGFELFFGNGSNKAVILSDF